MSSSEQPRPNSDAAQRRKGIWSAVRFVVVFLISTTVLLTASRFAIGTPAMNWYLFHVASNTVWLLRGITHSSDLEEVGRQRANAAGIRKVLDGWSRGESIPDHVTLESDPAAPPLTPWESWQFRSGMLTKEVSSEQAKIASLEGLGPSTGTPEERIQGLNDAVATLEATARRHGLQHASQVAYPEFAATIGAAKSGIAGLDASSPDFAKRSDEIESMILSIRDLQAAFLSERLSELQHRMTQDTGPLVSLIVKPSTNRLLEEARQQLSALENDPAKAGEADELRAEVARLESSLHDTEKATTDKDVQFRFSVVAACGALDSMAIFVSAMIAFPARWWKRAAGIAAGLPLLYGINIVRLACLGLIGAYTEGGEMFDFAHHYVWQGIYIVFVVAIWMLWVELLVKPRRPAPAAAA